jgi:hypothetical protein
MIPSSYMIRDMTPTAELWRQQETASGSALFEVEAVLGSRGEYSNGVSYIGKRTASLVGVSRFPRSADDVLNGATISCADPGGNSAAGMQGWFLDTGSGPELDILGLDPDGDGFACNWGEQVKAIAAKYGH